MNNTEVFLDNLFEEGAKEQEKANINKEVRGKIWLDEFGFKTKIVTGVVEKVYYSKTSDVNIYMIKSKDNQIYKIYEFDLIN